MARKPNYSFNKRQKELKKKEKQRKKLEKRMSKKDPGLVEEAEAEAVEAVSGEELDEVAAPGDEEGDAATGS